MTPVLASACTFSSNCIFRVNNSWSQRSLFRLIIAMILLSCLPFKADAAETQARICISVLSGMKSQSLQLSLNEAQQSIVVKDPDSKIKTAYHFAAGRLRVVGEQGPKLAIILVGSKNGKSKFEESQFDIVDRDEVNLRLMLDPNTSFAVHQYLIDELYRSHQTGPNLMAPGAKVHSRPLMMVADEFQFAAFISRFRRSRSLRQSTESVLQSLVRYVGGIVEIPSTNSLNPQIAKLSSYGIPTLRIFNSAEDMKSANLEAIETGYPSTQVQVPKSELQRPISELNIPATKVSAPVLPKVVARPKATSTKPTLTESLEELREYINKEMGNPLSRFIPITKTGLRKSFNTIRRKYPDSYEPGKIVWWDFFSAEQLSFIVDREKLALPSQELIRIDLLKSEDPSAEDNMTNSAVLHFERFVKAASLEELRSQLKKQDLWFVKWFTSLLSSHPGPAKLDNPVGWWEFLGNDTIKKLILSGTVTIPPYALEKLNLSFDQLEVTEQEIKRLRNFSAWVEISDPIELRSKINFENQWFGKSFRDLRSKYSLSWPIVFDLATLGKLVATGRIEVPTQYVKQLRLNNIDRSRMLIMSANGLSVALPDDSGLNPILLDPSINLYIDHVQNWILHSDLGTIAKALHSPNAQTPIEPKVLQALMLDFKGMTANDRPGWWLFLSDPALRKLSQISTIWIPQSVKERF